MQNALDAGNGKEVDSPLEEGMQLCQHLDVSLVRLVEDGWPSEL